MKSKKIFILLPDGVGLRNFAFTSFADLGKKYGWEVIFWNHTPFRISDLGFKEIKLTGKPRALTDLYKRAKIESELTYFESKFKDPVYSSYKFPPSKSGWKNQLKNILVKGISEYYSGEKDNEKLRHNLEKSERKGEYYKHCLEVLKNENPDLIFCTNQRAVNAIAPITAAKDLGISTNCFIFSWDNLPKATKIIDTDYYTVWSDYMKNELLSYYPYIEESQVKITGSPQFEPHFDQSLKISKEKFYNQNCLESGRDYLCYSGDDITTAPHDEYYLRDVAQSVRELNSEGENIGVIFRRSPVDTSGRYDWVLERYKDVVVSIEPIWKQMGAEWNTVLPSKADLKLQTNIIQHTFMVINVGSSMVFDYASYGLPCSYINYNPDVDRLEKDIREVYKYLHFQSMPSDNAVFWINSRSEIYETIKTARNDKLDNIQYQSNEWFKIINSFPYDRASERIWKVFNEIVE